MKITPAQSEALPQLVAELPPGSILELSPGMYDCPAPLVASATLHIRGAGIGLTKLVQRFETSEPLISQGENRQVRLEHLTLRASADGGCLVSSMGGELALDHVLFEADRPTEMPRTGLKVGAGRVEMIQCRFADLDVGVALRGQTSAVLEHCRFTHNTIGLALIDGARATLNDCVLEGQTKEGIALSDQSAVTLGGETIIKDTPRGVGLLDAARGQIVGARFSGCKEVGLWLSDRGAVEVDWALFEGNETGVLMGGRATCEIKDTSFVRQSGDGIVFEGRGDGVLKRCKFEGGRRAGIRLDTEREPEILECLLEDHMVAGMVFERASRGRVEDCVMRGNGTAVVLGDDTSPTLSRNTIASSRHQGAVIKDRSQPTFVANTFKDNTRCGMHYKGESSGLAVDNKILNSDEGIGVWGRASPTLRKNHFEGCGLGLRYTNGSAGTAEQNSLQGGTIGIEVMGHARPLLMRNVCRDNTTAGIRASESAEGVIEGNICQRAAIGIHVLRNAAPILRGNVASDNGRDYALPDNVAQDTQALVRAQAVSARVPRQVHGAVSMTTMEKGISGSSAALPLVAALLAASMSPIMGIAVLFVGLPVWLWFVHAVLKGRQSLLSDGMLVHGKVLSSGDGRVEVEYKAPDGRALRRESHVSADVGRSHVKGMEVPVIIDASNPDRAAFPTLERLQFLPPPPAGDTRPEALPGQPSPVDPSPERLVAPLFQAPIEGAAAGKRRLLSAAPNGELIISDESLILAVHGEDKVSLQLSEPFVVHLAVWLVTSTEAELSVSIRPRGALAQHVVLNFRVELPQSGLRRDLPLKDKPSPYMQAADFAKVWPRIRYAASLHGADPGGKVQI